MRFRRIGIVAASLALPLVAVPAAAVPLEIPPVVTVETVEIVAAAKLDAAAPGRYRSEHACRAKKRWSGVRRSAVPAKPCSGPQW